MKVTLVNVLKSVLCVGVTASCLVAAAPAQAQEGYPPETYIATSEPAYFEGRPVYYYGGYWYYRDGHAWRHYASEPYYLRDYRGAHAHFGSAYYYGRSHGGGYRHR